MSYRPIAGFFAACVIALMMLGGNPLTKAQAGLDVTNHRATMIRMLGTTMTERSTGGEDVTVFEAIRDSGDPLYIAPLVDLARFAPILGVQSVHEAVYAALAELTGQDFGPSWPEYFTWTSENDIALPPSYDEYKGMLFSLFIDPQFARFFEPGVQENARINLLEAVWGGVRVDGIPSLVNARQISPAEALAEGENLTIFCRDGDCRYPAPDEFVFGVSINGDNRAYPFRLMNPHEMFNDVLGHTPMLDQPDGETVCNFRAPTLFRALARSGDAWVQIDGVSAGCPESGWLAAEALQWPDSDWDTVRDTLPDIDAGDDALDFSEGVAGQVSGMPVMLAYCTLCGSGILYDATIPDLVVDGVSHGETVLEFGSTGLLMRSNKLMYDRNTDTVWNAFTGEPAFGPLVESDVQLTILPVVVSDWATWLAEHPDTSVLSLNTGYRRDYANGATYSDYFNDPDYVMFPVWQQDTSENENKEMVFGLNINGETKAYPLRLLVPERVTNDTFAGVNLVIVTRATPDRDFFEPGGAAVRAYERGEHTFAIGESANEIVDESGAVWTVTEDALVGPDGEMLPRLGGHLGFWFGWYAFYPDSLVYGGETE